jgi:hypothetical protein
MDRRESPQRDGVRWQVAHVTTPVSVWFLVPPCHTVPLGEDNGDSVTFD